MASKRKLNFRDVSSVEEPADSASVHGVVTSLSPIKSSKSGSRYFDGALSDGKDTMKLVGFKVSQHAKISELMEKKHTASWTIAK